MAKKKRPKLTTRMPPWQERIWREQERERMKQKSALPSYATFDDYVADNPEGERFRAWLTMSGHRPDILLIPGEGPHGSLPGGYIWAHAESYNNRWTIYVHDNDDGLMKKNFATEEEAHADLEMLTELAPFHMDELREFGYEWD